MAGFLDKNTRVIDFVLTGEGKYLLSRGELRFSYWIPFDDEVDYKPFVVNSGSMTDLQLSASVDSQIENGPVREATTGYKRQNMSGSDETNVQRPLFTVPQGHRVVPRIVSSNAPSGSIDLQVKQRKILEIVLKKDKAGKIIHQLGPFEKGVERFDSSNSSFDYGYHKDSFPRDHAYDGFLVRVYRSGTEGLVEIDPRRDLLHSLSYGNELRIEVNESVGDEEDG